MFTYGYQRNPLEHCFQDAKRFGYDFIELWGGRPHAFAPDLKAGEIEEVKRLVDKYEIPVLGYTPEHNAYPYNFMIGSELQRRDAVEYLKICLDVAKELGADYMMISQLMQDIQPLIRKYGRGWRKPYENWVNMQKRWE